ncbi:receptor-type adenlyate cyclase [Trypanosoma conorhini]|uniref:Receptor-type adenlyate cyclase n=1 Tax=Trypanosoma conorhini TaxID=83891 RepID=A0A422N4D4_9TRYP|nr:receptor-type adenlyate cyclase [Trypanosoma conorhini]RNF00310.1 receptor-type adenlyate cyclase [Trypanosoma conorhini]
MGADWGQRGRCAQLGSRPFAASPYLLLLVVFLLLLSLLPPHSAAAQSAAAPDTPVKVLLLKRNDLGPFSFMSNAFYAGVHASLRAHNSTAAGDVLTELVERESDGAGVATVLEDVMQKEQDILTLLAEFGDTYLGKVLSVLPSFDLVSFAPFTGSNFLRGWNPNVYFVRVSPVSELQAIIRYAVTQLRVLRLGFMYLLDEYFDETDYGQAQRVLSGMGYEFCYVFAVKPVSTGEANSKEFDDEWEQFVATQPQAVIMFGAPTASTAQFIKRMLEDERTAGAYLLTPFMFQPFVLQAWRAAVGGGAKFVPGQVIATGTNPLAKDASYDAIRRFQAVMREYLKNSGQRDYKDTEHFLNNDDDGEMMVDGWIAGEVLAQALRNW